MPVYILVRYAVGGTPIAQQGRQRGELLGGRYFGFKVANDTYAERVRINTFCVRTLR